MSDYDEHHSYDDDHLAPDSYVTPAVSSGAAHVELAKITIKPSPEGSVYEFSSFRNDDERDELPTTWAFARFLMTEVGEYQIDDAEEWLDAVYRTADTGVASITFEVRS